MTTTTKLFVGNVPDDAQADELRVLFEKFGAVAECDIVKNYAFVHFDSLDDARSAVAALHQSDFQGRNIRVEISTSTVRQKAGMGDVKGCYNCGGSGHLSRDCPSEPGGGRGGRGRGRGGYRGGGMRGGRGGRDSYEPYPHREPYARDPYARDPYARDPYARDPYARDPYARDPYEDPYYYPRERYPPRDRYAPYDPYERRMPRDPYAADPYERPPPEAYYRGRPEAEADGDVYKRDSYSRPSPPAY